MTSDAPLQFVAMVRARGGGKRARMVAVGSDDMKVKLGDSDALTTCFNFSMPDIKKFIMAMEFGDLGKFRDMVAYAKANPARIATNSLPFIADAVTLQD